MDLYKLSTTPTILYMNSYLHYCKKKEFDIDGIMTELHISLLEKRFLNTINLDTIQLCFPYCKLKDLDKYYIQVISYRPINQKSMFYNLLEKNIIISIEEFINMLERS